MANKRGGAMMHYVLGMILRDNDAEVLDDETPGKESYSFAGLVSAIAEGNRRFAKNPNIKQINIYEVFDGVKRASPQGRLGLVHTLFPVSGTGESTR